MISAYFETTVPVSSCNLFCEYCYVIQENRRNSETTPILLSANEIRKAFSKERIGGKAFISMCGYGETLLCNEIPEIVHQLLAEGHILNITTNGTITTAIERLVSLPHREQCNLLFSFSLHYIELKNRNMLKTFADNVRKVINSNCSCFVQICLCDSYIECLDEIIKYCTDNFGAMPQATLARSENGQSFSVMSKLSRDEYHTIAQKLDSPLFEFTYRYFNSKKDVYCFAGAFSYKFDLATGDLRRCYFEQPFFNLYNCDAILPRIPVAHGCKMNYCINSSHFISQGIAPELKEESYISIRNRYGTNWIKNNLFEMLNDKLPCIAYRNKVIEDLINKKVILYGAGVAAMEIFEFLTKLGIRIDSVVVSEYIDNKDNFGGISIRRFDDFEFINDAVVIICTKNLSENIEIRKNVNSHGYECYLYQEVVPIVCEGNFINE